MARDDGIWRDMNRMQKKMDRMMKSFMNRPFKVYSEDEEDFGMPSDFRKAFTDFSETQDSYILHVELPGMNKEDIVLDVVDATLEIRAEKKEEKGSEDEETGFSKSFAGFYQRIALPENADTTLIDATYKNGILYITVKKTHPDSKRSGVTIK